MSDGEARSDRFELAVLLAVYVVPLLATVVFLAWVGLAGIALALLAVELGVSAAVVRARPGRRPGPAVVVLAALAVLAGAGAIAVLTGLVQPGTGG